MEGLFTIVLFSDIRKDEKTDETVYGFITHSDGTTTAKSPEGMFSEDYIDNDLGKVSKSIDKFYDLG